MYDRTILNSNVDAVLRPLTDTEREVKEYIEKTYFVPLAQRHWEGVEVKEYWNTLKQ